MAGKIKHTVLLKYIWNLPLKNVCAKFLLVLWELPLWLTPPQHLCQQYRPITKDLEIYCGKSIENLLVGRLVVFIYFFLPIKWWIVFNAFKLKHLKGTGIYLAKIQLCHFSFPQNHIWKASILLNLSCCLLLSIKGNFCKWVYAQLLAQCLLSWFPAATERKYVLTLNRKDWQSHPTSAEHTHETGTSNSAHIRFMESSGWPCSLQVATSL